jgi:hypothetical protein
MIRGHSFASHVAQARTLLPGAALLAATLLGGCVIEPGHAGFRTGYYGGPPHFAGDHGGGGQDGGGQGGGGHDAH